MWKWRPRKKGDGFVVYRDRHQLALEAGVPYEVEAWCKKRAVDDVLCELLNDGEQAAKAGARHE